MSPSQKNCKLEAALNYQKQGFSVIPLGADKKALIKWEQYQHTRASEGQIRAWWTQLPNANIGIVTGAVSKIVVLDVDIKNGVDGTKSLRPLPVTACTKTYSGGGHYYFNHPGVHVATSAGQIGAGLDMRGDGAYVVAPPSKIGFKEYEWLVPLEEGIADMPEWLLESTTKRGGDKKWLKGINGVPEGQRNDTAASMAGKILSSSTEELWGDPYGKVLKSEPLTTQRARQRDKRT